MSDGISDAIKAAEKEDRWREVILPYVIKNNLHKRGPLELSPVENSWVYNYYMWEDIKPYLKLIDRSKQTAMRYWDAYLGQGEFKHYKHKGKTKVKIK